ncbi:MAG: hypothetical protein ACYC27_14820 [Armatimonadota bacterium]
MLNSDEIEKRDAEMWERFRSVVRLEETVKKPETRFEYVKTEVERLQAEYSSRRLLSSNALAVATAVDLISTICKLAEEIYPE